MEVEECSICLETWIDKTKGRVFIKCSKNCQGRYHATCFNKWYYGTDYIIYENSKIKLSKTCPYCRQDFEIQDFIAPIEKITKKTQICNIL